MENDELVEITKIRYSNESQTLEDAFMDIIDNNQGSRTYGAILLTELADGTYEIGDGFHRVAEAIERGDKFISAEVRREVPNGQ